MPATVDWPCSESLVRRLLLSAFLSKSPILRVCTFAYSMLWIQCRAFSAESSGFRHYFYFICGRNSRGRVWPKSRSCSSNPKDEIMSRKHVIQTANANSLAANPHALENASCTKHMFSTSLVLWKLTVTWTMNHLGSWASYIYLITCKASLRDPVLATSLFACYNMTSKQARALATIAAKSIDDCYSGLL